MSSFCSACGAPREEGRKFCTACGTGFSSGETPAGAASTGGPQPAASPSSPSRSAGSLASPPAAPPPAAPSFRQARSGTTPIEGIARLQLAGVILAAVSVYLPWIKSPDGSFNAYKIWALSLLDRSTTTRGVELGLVILVLAGIVLADLLVHSPTLSKVAFGAGIAEIVIGVLFIIQLSRTATETSQSLRDLIGIAPFATIAAGAMITAATLRTRAETSSSE